MFPQPDFHDQTAILKGTRAPFHTHEKDRVNRGNTLVHHQGKTVREKVTSSFKYPNGWDTGARSLFGEGKKLFFI